MVHNITKIVGFVLKAWNLAWW